MSPKRVQRQRTKGWRMPEGCVYVGRPTKWGNPFEVYRCSCCDSWDVRDNNGVTYFVSHEYAREHGPFRSELDRRYAACDAVRLFAAYFDYCATITREEVRAELAGRDLMCWCPEDVPCHADVLLELANGGEL